MAWFFDAVNPVTQAKKGASTVTYVVLMLIAIILIAVGIGLLGSWNIMSGMILLLVGGGIGFVAYTMQYGSVAGADEDDDDDSDYLDEVGDD